MKRNIIALVLLMMSPCMALTLEDMENMILQELAQEPEGALREPADDVRVHGFDAMMARVNHQLRWYFTQFGVRLNALPKSLQQKIQKQTQLLAQQLVAQEAKQKPLSSKVIQAVVGKMLSAVFDHTARYVELPQVPDVIEKSIKCIKEQVGLKEKDLKLGAHNAIKKHKAAVHKMVEDRLKKTKRTYTTDREISAFSEEQTQLLLKLLWLNMQKQVQQLTMDYLKKHHAKTSFYGQPAEAQRLQLVANAIKKQCKGF